MGNRGLRQMMVRVAAGWALAGLLALPVMAGTPEEDILASLEAQGYHLVVRDRTWLGRIWMIVESDEVRREIVFNPGTGEILRDYAVMRTAAQPSERKSSRTTGGVISTLSVDGSTGPDDGVSVDQMTTGAIILGEPAIVYPADGQ